LSVVTNTKFSGEEISMRKTRGRLDFCTSPSWPESTATFSIEGPPPESEFKPTYQIAIAL
jgi:hypothetical protein